MSETALVVFTVMTALSIAMFYAGKNEGHTEGYIEGRGDGYMDAIKQITGRDEADRQIYRLKQRNEYTETNKNE